MSRRSPLSLGAAGPLRAAGPLCAAGTALAIALLAPACDNPACIFGPTGCNGGTVGVGDNPATLPQEGETIEMTTPTIVDSFPDAGDAAEVTTPIVLVFSESMSPRNYGTTPPSGLGTAFKLESTLGASIPLPAAALVGDGKVLVLFPPADLMPDTTYNIVLSEMSQVADRTGQSLVTASNGLIGGFTTLAAPTALPRLLAAFPRQGGTNQSTTPEIVAVFDRRLDEQSVDGNSFVVEVDGAPPLFDPPPTPLVLGGGLVTETRVYRWKSVDGSGVPASLGEGSHVEVSLSGTGHEIEDETGAVLAPTSFAFDVAEFSPPTAVAITSDPHDAIGIDQISGPANLAIESLLSGASSGDHLILTMFGLTPSVPTDPPLVALQRDVELVAPFDAFTMTAAEIDLLASSNPVRGRFLDGPLTMAFQLKHGNVVSPVKLLDVEPLEPGLQSPLLDTVAPTLIGLSTSGSILTSIRSDLRDLVLVGRATEDISRALVVTPLGDNSVQPGVAPPAASVEGTGLFVTAPVRLGVIPETSLPVDFTLTIYDRALNSAAIQSDGSDPDDGFDQVGQIGPGNALPGGTVSVHVFDATTRAPVALANVHVAELRNGSVIPVAGGLAVTDVEGRATVPAAVTGKTILSVEKAGFDVFTFEDLAVDRLGVPLQPTVLAPATASGTVGPADQAAVLQLNFYTRAAVDSRRPEGAPIFAPVSSCSLDGDDGRFECPFGPIPVRPRRVGAQSAITVLVPPDLFLYSALTFLKTAEIFLPVLPVDPGADEETHLPLGPLLDAGTLDPEERPIEAPLQLLSTAAWPTLAGDPVVAVEASAPGIPGSVAVGRGVAFDDGLPPGAWTVRAAYPGSVDGIQDIPTDALGRLVTQGTIDPDLQLRVEVFDPAGNQGGARPRFSQATGALTLPAAPVLPANPATPNAGGMAFDLAFPDVLPDALAAPGKALYRVRLTDSLGRGWTIYLPDPSDAQGPDVVAHVPDLAGTFPLAPGALDARISAWSWPGLDPAEFLWTDIEREHDLFVHSIGQSFTPP
jgi:hypothetical protein